MSKPDEIVENKEVYYDGKMPQVTKTLFSDCSYVEEKIKLAVGKQNKYKYQVCFFLLDINTFIVTPFFFDVLSTSKTCYVECV